MNIKDKAAFLRHRKRLVIDLLNGKQTEIIVNLNIKTSNYLQLVCMADLFKAATSDKEKNYMYAEMVNEILTNSNLSVNTEWILNNITPISQRGMINFVCEYIDGELKKDCYIVPDIKIVKNTANNNKIAKERENKQAEIRSLQNSLKKKQEIELMDEIAFVCKETSNTYWDIMEMPILTYKCMVKTLATIIMRSDDDYNLAYLRKQAKEETKKLNEKNDDDIVINQPPKERGADLKLLKSLLNK